MKEINEMSNPLRNEADAGRTIVGLSSTGYETTTAIADIIDNSIAADASEVKIEILLQTDGRKFVFIGDNGHGMNYDQLFSAMKYGSPKRDNPKSLGKFGLGLNTSSSSVCRRYSLISKASSEQDLVKLTWDLDYVEDIDDWVMFEEPLLSIEKDMFDSLCGETGTLVVWKNCDKLLPKNYDEPGGQKEQTALRNRIRSIKSHCGLVFHRFLDVSDESYQNVSIEVNGELIEPWNPFWPEKSEQVLAPQLTDIDVEVEDGSIEKAKIYAWILPHEKDCDKKEHKEKAKIATARQGLYIYREGRLIFHGGYRGLFRDGEHHCSLFRVQFEFGYELDEAFSVDVRKMSVDFDPALSEELVRLLSGPRRTAEQRYRRKEKVKVASGISHDDSNKTISETPNTSRASVDSVSEDGQSATINNNLGQNIKILSKICQNLDPNKLFVDAVDQLESGSLWEPCLNSSSNINHSTGVRLNKSHDFYTKIYPRAGSKYSVEGLDLLLWALAAAEQNNCDEELQNVWEDIRDEVSSNLKRLLRNIDLPSG